MRRLYPVFSTLVFAVVVFLFCVFYTHSKAFEYLEEVEGDISRLALFHLKSAVLGFSNEVSDLLKASSRFPVKTCRGCSFVVWMDVDGNVLESTGSFPEDLYDEGIVQAALYGDYDEVFSDVYFTDREIHVRSAVLIQTDDGRELIGVFDRKVPSSFFSHLEGVLKRSVFFISESGEIFGEGFEVEEDLLKGAEESQSPVVRIEPERSTTVIPVFDFEEWNLKGFIVVSRNLSGFKGKISRTTLFFAVFVFSSLVPLILGLRFALIRRKRVYTTLFLSSIPILASLVALFLHTVPKILESEYGAYTDSAVEVIGEDVGIWKDRIDEMKKILNVQVVVKTDGKVSSTLKKTLLEKIGNWRKVRVSGGIELGEVEVNRVLHTYMGFELEGSRLFVLKEKTPLVNSVVKSRFVGLTVLGVSVFFLLILGFSIENIERPRLLKATFVGYAFLAPALIHLVWWAVGPVAFSFFLAFHRWNVIDPAKPFVGLGHFKELFHDKLFWNAMKNTALFSLQVPISMFLSLLLAIGVNRRTVGMTFLRTIYYLPAVTSGVSTIIVWRWILNKEYGILNYILGFLGVPKIPWLTSPKTALIAIMLMSIWQSLGSQMIIFLAGLQSIPQTFYDAASVDGASSFQKFRHITLPLLKPTTLFVLVTSIIGSFQIFTPVYVLTQGGPLRSTDVVFYHIWESAWIELKMGYAAAQSWMLFLVLLILTYMEFKLFGRESWQQYF